MSTRRTLAAALALTAPWALAACDPSGGSSDATVTTAVSAPASAAAGTTAGGATASASPVRASATRTGATRSATATPTTGSGGGGEVTNCVNPMLSVTRSTSDGAAGTMVQRFVLKNTGSVTCSMHGRPTVVPYGSGLPVVAVGAIPAGFGDLGGSGGTVVLAPGGTAAFFLKWSDVPVNDNPCPSAAGFAFRAPLDPLADGDKTVAFAFQPCGAAAQVSEVLPASVTS
ncbi:DUF4232 domain-containing protein [Kitasatospora paranensis]|uniref:DUF4232 domain-containing protein n=1 Tax=Kitasatospora paranensis TaxID=258053 RepID=A0ABW2G6U3_9ACTN